MLLERNQCILTLVARIKPNDLDIAWSVFEEKNLIVGRTFDADGKVIWLENPLTLTLSVNAEVDALAFLSEKMSAEGFDGKDLRSEMRRLANQRNQLLYASKSGTPKISLNDFQFYHASRIMTLVLLGISCCILQTKEKLPFVEQILYGMLHAMLSAGVPLQKTKNRETTVHDLLPPNAPKNELVKLAPLANPSKT